MKKLWMLLLFGFPAVLWAQNVGINTSFPLSPLHVEQGSVLFNGLPGVAAFPGPVPISGRGIRLMWYPDKAAFRAGGVNNNEWEKDSIGICSIAAGYNTKAKGPYTVAMGLGATAGGDNAVAIGYNNFAAGVGSTAFGYDNKAIGAFSTAYGRGNTASGINAMAFGTGCKTSGAFSTSFGRDCNADADNTTAFGQQATASGTNSFAIGSYISTSGYTGAFALGDASTTTVMNSFVANGFRARFAGGYRLFTNSAASVGAFLNANANSWAALSDVRMKENFLPVDGEAFLKKIAAMPQVSWNYIGQDAKTLRHYGPMAQDFYQAFGRDNIGEIGCDTLINQQDFLGVNLIAIQALEKRTEKIDELEHKMEKLEKENALLKEQMNALLEAIKADRVGIKASQ